MPSLSQKFCNIRGCPQDGRRLLPHPSTNFKGVFRKLLAHQSYFSPWGILRMDPPGLSQVRWRTWLEKPAWTLWGQIMLEKPDHLLRLNNLFVEVSWAININWLAFPMLLIEFPTVSLLMCHSPWSGWEVAPQTGNLAQVRSPRITNVLTLVTVIICHLKARIKCTLRSCQMKPRQWFETWMWRIPPFLFTLNFYWGERQMG